MGELCETKITNSYLSITPKDPWSITATQAVEEGYEKFKFCVKCSGSDFEVITPGWQIR